MSDTKGLHRAWLLDGKGGGTPVDWSGVIAHTEGDDLLWVDLDFATPEARQWLSSVSQIPRLALEKLLTSETRPGTQTFNEGLLIILRGVNLNPGAAVEDMISVRIWIDSHRIVTCRQRELQSLRTVEHLVRDGNGPRSTGELVTLLTGELASRIRQVVLDMEDTLADFETGDNESDNSAEALYSDLRRRTAVLRRHLNPQRDAMLRLQNYQGDLINPVEHNDLQIHTDAIIHSIEDLEVLREQTQALQDELFSAIARGQNERMYMLTIVAAIFLPLTFISGLLGMNVGGIPWAASPIGFWGIVGLCAVVVGFMLLYFRHKHWL
jgi:zinc transporter